MVTEKPVVAIWRNAWLPPSETFVRNQIAALNGWDVQRVGLIRASPSIVEPDFVTMPAARLTLPIRALQWFYPRFYRAGFMGLGRAQRHLERHNVRLIHAHFGFDAILASELSRRTDIPLVVTFHGYDVTERLGTDLRQRWYERELRGVFEQAHTLIGVSDFITSRLIALGAPGEKVVTSYIGVPVSDRPRSDAASGICFVGRLIQKKGVDDLLEAVSLLPSPHRSVRVTIVGDGPLRPDFEAQASRLGINADFVGYQPSSEVARLLDDSLLFCGPSKTSTSGGREAFGMVFLEAAGAGIPAVAYRQGGVPEAVADGESGLLVPEGDVVALSAALEDLLSNPDKAALLGRAGRDRVATRFDIRSCTADLERIYDKASASSSSTPGPTPRR
jgi:glycosyltransferase involved in cell wall biosynthesis